MLETFHLKLQTICATLALVRDWVAREQLPFLNLRSESFRVRLGETDAQLPFLWNSSTTLAFTGEAIALPVETTALESQKMRRSPAAVLLSPASGRK